MWQRLKAGAPSKIRGGLVCLCLRPPWGFPRPAWRSVFCRGDLPFNPLSKTLSPHYVESFQYGILTTSAITFPGQIFFINPCSRFITTCSPSHQWKGEKEKQEFAKETSVALLSGNKWEAETFFKLSKYIFDPLACHLQKNGTDVFSLGAFNGEHLVDGSVRGMWWMQMCSVIKFVSQWWRRWWLCWWSPD